MASSSTSTTPSSTTATRLVVVAPTLNENRFLLAKQTCEEAAKHQIRLILVDASPLKEKVWDILRKAGTNENDSIEYVKIIQQQSIGKKGAALREGIAEAKKELDDYNDGQSEASAKHIIGFQEPEKVDMIRHWKTIIEHMIPSSSKRSKNNDD